MRILANFAAALAFAIAISTPFAMQDPAPAEAAFHFAEIHEVQVGFNGNPDVQFVEINMFSTGQGFVQNSRLAAWGPTGTYLGVVLLVPNNVNSTTPGQRWIMGTPAFETASGIQADFEFAPGILSSTGGQVCWGSFGGESNPLTHVDCVAYGNYSGTGGSAAPNGVSANPPGDCDESLTRIMMSIANSMSPPDDTWRGGNAATDFDLLTPSPRNNLNQDGTLVPTDTDGDTMSNCVDPDNDNDNWLNTCETNSTPPRDPLNSGSVPVPPGGIITNPPGLPTGADSDADHAIDGCEASAANPGGTTDPVDADSDNDGVQDGVEEAAGTDPNANPSDYSDAADDDGDGCSNAKELTADDSDPARDRHPGNFWDFYSIDDDDIAGYDPNNNVDLSDTLDILGHFGEAFNGGAYTTPQGQGYDRTRLLSPTPFGALIEGNNGIDLSEALAALAQFGFGGAGCVAPGPVPAQGGGIVS